MASWPLSPSSCHVPSPTAGISPPLFSPKLCANTIFSVDRLLGHLSDHFALQDPQNRLISTRHPQNSQRSWPYTTRRSGQRRSEREPLREAVAYRSGPARPPGCYRSSWRIYIGRGRTCAVEAEEGKSGLGSGEGSQHASKPASTNQTAPRPQLWLPHQTTSPWPTQLCHSGTQRRTRSRTSDRRQSFLRRQTSSSSAAGTPALPSGTGRTRRQAARLLRC